MNPVLTIIVSSIASALLASGGAYLGVRIALAVVQFRVTTHDTQIAVINSRLGLSAAAPEPVYMTRSECPLMDGTMRADLATVKDRLGTLEREVREFMANHHPEGA